MAADHTKLIFIAIVVVIHICVHNRFEKAFVQLIWGPHLKEGIRPSEACASKDPVPEWCYGMPSGHAEAAAIVGSMLWLWRFVPWYVAAGGIVAVGLQRIWWRRHTVLQVIAGVFVGGLYAGVYVSLWNVLHPFLAAAACIVFLTALIAVNTEIITRRQNGTAFPEWVPAETHGLIRKKQVETDALKRAATYGATAMVSEYGFLTWEDLERMMDGLMEKDLKGKEYDVIVGIRTGGAIIAAYMGLKMGLPVDFMRTKLSKYGCSSGVRGIVDSAQDVGKRELNIDSEYQVCEEPRLDLRGKRVLLVDELSYSGGTIASAKKYLLEKRGAASVETLVVSNHSKGQKRNAIDYDAGMGVAAWPWSFDN